MSRRQRLQDCLAAGLLFLLLLSLSCAAAGYFSAQQLQREMRIQERMEQRETGMQC